MLNVTTANFVTATATSGFTGDLSGNAATATKLKNKLTINNHVFDGSQDISVNITSGTSSGTTTNTGILAGYNTAIGDGALSKNGYSSVINEITQTISTIGIGNVAIGSQSLLNNTTGSFNTAVGCMAVNDASFNGNKNTTIGAFSDISGNIENSTAIGANAIVTTSHTIQLGDSNITNVNTDGDIYTTGNINATTFNGSHFQGIGTTSSVITSVGIFNSYITTPQISVSGDASFNKIYGGKNGEFKVDTSGNVTAPKFIGDLSGTNISASTGLKISNSITLTGSDGTITTSGKITASDFSGNFSGGTVTANYGSFNSSIGVGSNTTNRQFSVDLNGIVTAPKFIGDLSGTNISASKLSVSGDASFNQIYGGSSGAFIVDNLGGTTVKTLKISNFITAGIAHIDVTTGNISNSKIVTADLDTSLSNLLSANPSFTTINATGNIESNSTTIGTIIVTGGIGVSGKVTATSFNATSDYRIKENVQQLDPTLFNVDKLNPVTYNKIDSGKQDIGFIAHEVQEVFPYLVTGEKDGEQTQSLNYLGLIGVLVKEIQELKKRVAILENR